MEMVAATTDHSVRAERSALLPCGPRQPWPVMLLARLIDWGLVVAAGVMILLVFFNVCTHAAGYDLSATTEVCELLMVWVSFLGGASIVRRSGHMAITEFLDKLDPKARLVADFCVQLFLFLIFGVLAWYGFIIIQSNWGNLSVVLQIPMAWQYMPLSIGSTASMVFVGYDLYQILRGKSRQERFGVDE